VKYNIILLAMTVAVFSGCITSQPQSNVGNLQIKIAHLERKVKEKDRDIEDLRFEVQNITNQMDAFEKRQMESSAIGFTGFDDMPVVSEGSDKEDTRVIRVNVSTKKLQSALKSAGYYKGSLDGKIGRETKRGIEEFQKDHGLTVDGIVGKRTWSELKNYL